MSIRLVLPLLAVLGAVGPSFADPVNHTAGSLLISLSPSCSVISLGPANNPDFSFPPRGNSPFGTVVLRTRVVGATSWDAATSTTDGGKPLQPLPTGELAASSQLVGGGELVLEQHYASARDSAGGILLWYNLRNTGKDAVEVGGFAVSFPSNEKTGGSLADLAAAASFADPYIGAHHGHVTMTRLTGEDGVLIVTGENGTSLEAFSDQWSPLNGKPNAWGALTLAWAETDWKHAHGRWVNASSSTIKAGQSITVGFRFLLAQGGVRRTVDALLAAGRPVVESVPGYVLSPEMSTATLYVHPPSNASLEAARAVNDDPGTSGTAPCLLFGPQQPVISASTGKATSWVSLPLRPLTAHCRVRAELTYSDGSVQVVSYFVVPALHEHLSTFGAFQSQTAFYDDDTDPFGRSPSVMPWDRWNHKHVLHDPRNFIVGLSDEAGAGANVGFAIKQRFAPVQAEVTALDRYINSTLWGVHCPSAPAQYQGDCSLQDHATHGIKASLFWTNASATWQDPSGMPGYAYEPEDFAGWKWDRDRAYSLFRAYNYPHQSVVYHSMYRLARDHPAVVTSKPAVWYLKQVAATVRAAWSRLGAKWYMQQGLMAGSVWLDVLRDLELEAKVDATMFAEDYEYVYAVMANRTLPGRGMGPYFSSAACPKPNDSPFQACLCQNCTADNSNPCTGDVNATTGKPIVQTTGVVYHCKSWADNPTPYGSEFSWDSTGQEEAYVWGRHFNQSALADTVLNAILAYDPAIPSWGYNGASLSYGDVSNNGIDVWNDTEHKEVFPLGGGIERVSGHYRSGLNMIPILAEYMRDPDQLYLLKLAVGGMTNCLPNIDGDGAASMGFHLNPANLQFDAYSGDWGIGFFGAARHSGSFLVDDPLFGALCFLCDIVNTDTNNSSITTVVPRDAWHKKLFIGSLGLTLISEAGTVTSFSIRGDGISVLFDDVAKQPLVSVLRLRVEQPAAAAGNRPELTITASVGGKSAAVKRGAWEVQPASSGPTKLDLKIA